MTVAETRQAQTLGAIIALGAAAGAIGYLLWKKEEIFGPETPTDDGVFITDTGLVPGGGAVGEETREVIKVTPGGYTRYAVQPRLVPGEGFVDYATPIERVGGVFTPGTWEVVGPDYSEVQPGASFEPVRTATPGAVEMYVYVKSCFWGGHYENALVHVVEANVSGLTDWTGTFGAAVPPGTYTVNLWKKGNSSVNPPDATARFNAPDATARFNVTGAGGHVYFTGAGGNVYFAPCL